MKINPKKFNSFQKHTVKDEKNSFDIVKKAEIWKKVTEEIDANSRVTTFTSRDFDELHINYVYKYHQIIITETDIQPLFIETDINICVDRKFFFTISKNEFVDRILTHISNKSYKTKNILFDKKYLIKTNNIDVVKKILKSPKKIENLALLDIFYIEGRSNNNKDQFCLKFNVNRYVNSSEYLKSLMLTFCDMIDSIEETL